MDIGRVYHIFSPPKAGTTNIIASGAIREPQNDMMAETRPLPRPVKNDDTNRLKPNKIQPSANMRKAQQVGHEITVHHLKGSRGKGFKDGGQGIQQHFPLGEVFL